MKKGSLLRLPDRLYRQILTYFFLSDVGGVRVLAKGDAGTSGFLGCFGFLASRLLRT